MDAEGLPQDRQNLRVAVLTVTGVERNALRFYDETSSQSGLFRSTIVAPNPNVWQVLGKAALLTATV